MSVQKLMFVTAVPFGLARFQSNASKTIVNMTGGIGVTQSTDNNNVRILPQFRTTVHKTINPRMTRKRNKMLQNRMTARISHEKIKHQKNLLEQKLLDIKVEKMKLLLENEDLKMRCSSLEKENNSLRMQLLNGPFQNESSQLCERTIKHASLVNIPQPKDWVLPPIFTLLMIVLRELFSSFQLKQIIVFHLSNLYQASSKMMKPVVPLTALLRQMMFLSAH